MPEPTYRPISQIAREIRANWKNVHYSAMPYLGAMAGMNKITDNYGMDSGHSVVRYFLSNATTWKGEVAREIKKELNAMLTGKPYTSPKQGELFV